MKRLLFFFATTLALASPNAHAATYKLLHAFTGGKTDGSTPTIESSLTPSGPNFYGVTLDGGQFTNGVVFQVPTNGGATKLLHTFNGWSVLNQGGSKADGAYPVGAPVLAGSTLYGMTEEGGSNGPSFGIGTVYSVNTNGSGFQVLHHFGAINDGWAPYGSLILADSTLFGMTSQGGTNGISEGIIFSMETNGSNYQILHSFTDLSGSPQGSLILWGTTLYGMTAGEIFRIETNGTTFLPVHQFAGGISDGSDAFGSVTRSGAFLYGMTSTGGTNGLGTIFQINLIGSVFKLLHSFSFFEANTPHGDLALSGSMLYGMSYGGLTNLSEIGYIGSGAVFQINTNGSDYQLLHVFEYPIVPGDGSLPFGTPLVLGSELYGMTSLGGSTKDGGCIFSLSITSGSTSAALSITNTSPLPTGSLDVVYHLQLGATGGTAPYTWAVASGQLPKGLTLSAAGLLTGKPTAGGVANFSIKITGHDKLTSTQIFTLTIEAPPKLVITTPKATPKVTTPTLTVSGTASGAVPLSGVYFQLNHGAWTKALTADVFAHWNYPNLPLLADTNIFSAYAEDIDGNFSPTNTVTFTYYVTSVLTVTINGNGTVTPNDNGKKLQVGATYSMTAKPGKIPTTTSTSTFTGWTDGIGNVLSQSATFKFVMASNLTLIANFFAPTVLQFKAQNYSGLFAPSEASRQNTNSGAIRLTLTPSGSFSGQLRLGPGTLPFTGQFDENDTTQILLTRSGNNTLTATLQLDSSHQIVTGEVADGSFVAPLVAYQSLFDLSNRATNYQGKYAVNIPIGNDPAAAGIATGSVTVDSLGNVTFTALLPDGTIVSQTSQVSGDGYWPLYVPLPRGRGTLWSWSQFTNGTVHWLP